MNDYEKMFAILTTGFELIVIGAHLGGAWGCLAYRRLTPWLHLAAVGFLGLFLVGALGQFDAKHWLAYNPFSFFYGPILAFVGMISTVVLLFGLGASLVDLRRKLAIAMEPKHVRT